MSDLPDDVADEAERLTRLATRAIDENEAAAYRRERDRQLRRHGFVARVRHEATRDVLVCYPDEWVEDDTVRTDRIEDLDRAVERPLEDSADEDEWENVDAHNRDLVATVEGRAGAIHGRNAAAFADFMANHYVRPMEEATATEVEIFLDDYFPRNAWPTDQQRAAVEESLRLVFEAVDRTPPDVIAEE